MSNSNVNRRCHVMLGHTRPSSTTAPVNQDPRAPRPGDVNGNLDSYFHSEERRYHALGRLEGNETPYPAGHDDHVPRNVARGNRPSSQLQDLDPRAVAAACTGSSMYDPRVSQAQYAAAVDPYAVRTSAAGYSVQGRGDWAQIQQAEVRQVSRPVARVTRDERTGHPVLLPLRDEDDEFGYEKKKRSSRIFGCFR